jgi:hypothetical protein
MGRRAAVGMGVAVLLLAAVPAQGQPAPVSGVQLITVVVAPGDTLWRISRRYGVSVEAIARANGLRDPDRISVGQRLVVPLPATRPARGAAPSSPWLVWPLRGEILSGFGARGRAHHAGVDIQGAYGAPVVAARAGRVVHAGWYYAYGLTVIVDHGGSVRTLYGHLSALHVRVGDAVAAGQPVGRVGCTGRCSGTHLHFEVRIQERPVDPLPLLADLPAPRATPPSPTAGPGALSDRPTGLTTTSTVVVEGSTVTRTVDTWRGGRLVARREEVVTVWGGLRRRVVREYRVEGGVLLLVGERVAVEEEQRD